MASDALSKFALAYIDGASHPVLVEEVWDSYQKYTRQVYPGAASWPYPGTAWEELGGILTEYEAAGRLVSCTNVNLTEHPHHHLVQGHESRRSRFIHGTPPMHLRYYATPDGSIAWQNQLQERRQQAEAKRRAEAERKARHVEATYRAIAAGVNTESQLRRHLSLRRHELNEAILALLDSGRITSAGQTRWLRRDQWRIVSSSTKTTDTVADADTTS